mgnify:CR=1 FL=1|jgi:hypothetical protein|tara:strand:+ start:43 stop:1170 length:1128 start_codon:yes stop_codon:yes gene_type:complete
MSTIKVNKIENTATADGGIAIDSSGHVQVDGQQLPTTGPLSNRNLIINGAMQVAQRSTSETGQTTLDGYVALDRHRIQLSSSGTFTISQSTEAPSGFANSLKFDCTTADSSPDYVVFFQLLEGQDLQQVQKGTSSAQKLTASFYVRSSKTGTYQVNIRDLDNNRLVGASYTIGSADTWELKTVTFPADTTGAFGNDANASLQLEWWLAAGSDYTGGAVPTAWEARVNTDRAAALNVAIGASTADDFYITGIQLEVGEKATPFEHRSYGDELAKCQRYFLRLGPGNLFGGRMNGSGNTDLHYMFPVTPRTTPSGSVSFDTASAEHGSSGMTVNSMSINDVGTHTATIRAAVSSGSDGNATFLKTTGTTTIDFSAEL